MRERGLGYLKLAPRCWFLVLGFSEIFDFTTWSTLLFVEFAMFLMSEKFYIV